MKIQIQQTPMVAIDGETVLAMANATTNASSRTSAQTPKPAIAGGETACWINKAAQLRQQLHAAAAILVVAGGLSLTASAFAAAKAYPVMLGIYAVAVFTLGAYIGLGKCRSNSLRRRVNEARQLGQYRLIAPLGTGGMGEVYLAEHRLLKRRCAVKMIRPERAGDPHVRARFEREVRTAAQLSHGNTVGIFDYGQSEDGTLFYAMEYLPGLNLEDLLQRHGPMSAERVIHLLRQTCGALSEVHANGLIHRDIKPGNIFSARRGGQYDVVKLLDFGLVKPMAEPPSTRLTREGAISGTPLFMSPEQARGLEEIDARSDIYSLGAVGYTLLCGRTPFEGASPLDVLIAHARDEVVPPSRFQADVPADLEKVILRCLAKNPADRFADAESLEKALADCAAAGQWTPADAAKWWRENEQEAVRDF